MTLPMIFFLLDAHGILFVNGRVSLRTLLVVVHFSLLSIVTAIGRHPLVPDITDIYWT